MFHLTLLPAVTPAAAVMPTGNPARRSFVARAVLLLGLVLLGAGLAGCTTSGRRERGALASLQEGERVEFFATIVAVRKAPPASPEVAAVLATLPTEAPVDAAATTVGATDDGTASAANESNTVTDATNDPNLPIIDDGLSANSPSLQAARGAISEDALNTPPPDGAARGAYDPFAEPDEPPTMLTLKIHQMYHGGLDAERITVRAEMPSHSLPLQAREAATRSETVILATCQRAGDQLVLVYAKGPDLEKWQCHACGRRLQAFRFDSPQFLEIRWYCPVHGYRDQTFEAHE